MTSPILYCGDTSLQSAAAYLAGLMSSRGWDFEYVPSNQPVSHGQVADRKLVILSDCPAGQVSLQTQQQLIDAVSGGCGLLMIGGWESFHGQGGDWDQTRLADILPVRMQSTDDRMNCDHPVMVRAVGEHPVVNGLPWTTQPPLIGGFNRFEPRNDAVVLLEVDRLSMSFDAGEWTSRVVETHSLLVLGKHGEGRTAAIATDVAPHWVGGFVDWGEGRVSAQADGAEAIEVGNLYAAFWQGLLEHLLNHNG